MGVNSILLKESAKVSPIILHKWMLTLNGKRTNEFDCRVLKHEIIQNQSVAVITNHAFYIQLFSALVNIDIFKENMNRL